VDRLKILLPRAIALPWFLLVLLLAGVVYEGCELYRAERYGRLLAAPERIEVDDDTPPPLIFAKAETLDRAGDRTEAQRLYGSILHKGDDRLRERVRYNLGTLYLREAAQIWNARGVLEYARVNTLAALARDNLREAVRLNPDNWDARFNLEYAHRITPPPKEREKADWHGSKSSVFATLPSLPGGAP
jgi:mxaK protein